MKPPVVTIDGPSGTGKGTISAMLVEALGWHFLDSGLIYRAIAWALLKHVVDPKDEKALLSLIAKLDIKIVESHVWCDDEDITSFLRVEEVGMVASTISRHKDVRLALLPLQRQFRQTPGLVTDGRDMGTVVFPDADLKIYLDADLTVRANRRYNQLRAKGIEEVALQEVKTDLNVRDTQDASRAISPLKPAADAFCIDTTHLNADEVFAKVMSLVREQVL